MKFDLRKLLKAKFVKFKAWWEDLPLENRKVSIFIFNYGVNALPQSFLVYIFMSLWLQHGFVRWLATFFSCWIFFLYYEYYFVWHKRSWEDYGKGYDDPK